MSKVDERRIDYSINFKYYYIIQELTSLYLTDARPLVIGYSGGKDSSVVVDIVLRMLLYVKNHQDGPLTKPIYIQFSDTLLEMDPVIEGIDKSIESIEAFAKEHELPINVIRVKPELKNTFFSLVIGKGYAIPRRDLRYCSQRLKILPQQKSIDKILINHGGFISITGSRKEESVDRKARLEKSALSSEDIMHLKKHENANCLMYTPIENFTSDEVWSYLYKDALSWLDVNELGRVYSMASADDGDECRSLLEGSSGTTPGCGKSSRYGCWLCTILTKDKTLNNLGNHFSYLRHMEDFRNWLVSFRDGQWENRDVYNHKAHTKATYNLDNHRKGMRSPGGYSIGFRKEILRKLKETEDKVLQDRKKPLISTEELTYIQELWIEEGDLDLSVEKIFGRKLAISLKHKKVLVLARRFHKLLHVKPELNGIRWFKSYYKNLKAFSDKTIDARFLSQLALQIIESDKSYYGYAHQMTHSQTAFNVYSFLIEENIDSTFLRTLKGLQITKQYYPNDREKEYIHKEWKEDTVGFVTFLDLKEQGEIEEPTKNLFGYDGDYGKHFNALEKLENGEDIINIPNEEISLADKMRWFDTF